MKPNMKSINVISELCSGCRGCELLCSFIVSREFCPGKGRIRLVKDDHQAISIPLVFCSGTCPKADSDDNPLCVAMCPTGALIYGDEEEIVRRRRELLERRAAEPLFRVIAPWKYPFPVHPRQGDSSDRAADAGFQESRSR